MWKCQICETLNEGNFCSVCGNPKPKAGAGSSDSPKSKKTRLKSKTFALPSDGMSFDTTVS